jgi:NADH dehydrogenase FAD-containing subunit
VFFLKHLHHARGIRNRTLELFEQAAFPNTPDDEKRRLLTFVVVGAGPTSCEYASELCDFVHEDIARMYPDLLQFVSIELIEAGAEVLSSFDASLKTYITRLFEERKISVRTATAVKAVEVFTKAAYRHEATKAVLSDGKEIEFGLMVWSAGLQPVKFTARTDFEKTPQGRVVVDEYLRVKGHEGTVWACGDCAQIEGFPLPQLAQVAQQQGEYIAEVLSARKGETDKEWHYFSLGSMMYAPPITRTSSAFSAHSLLCARTQVGGLWRGRLRRLRCGRPQGLARQPALQPPGRRRVAGVALGVLGKAGVAREQATHPNVLVQGVGVWKVDCSVLSLDGLG